MSRPSRWSCWGVSRAEEGRVGRRRTAFAGDLAVPPGEGPPGHRGCESASSRAARVSWARPDGDAEMEATKADRGMSRSSARLIFRAELHDRRSPPLPLPLPPRPCRSARQSVRLEDDQDETRFRHVCVPELTRNCYQRRTCLDVHSPSASRSKTHDNSAFGCPTEFLRVSWATPIIPPGVQRHGGGRTRGATAGSPGP